MFDIISIGSRLISGCSRISATESSIRARQCVGDYGFRQCAARELIKNEDTWCDALGHLRCRIRFNPEIIRKDFEGWCNGRCFVRNRNADGNLYVRYLYWNDTRWNWNYNWLNNDWNDNNPALVPEIIFVLPLTFGRKFYYLIFLVSFFHTSRQDFCHTHLVFLKERYIFYHPWILFPITQKARLSLYPFCV